MKLWHALWRDERGFILSTELLIIATVLVVGLTAGFVAVRAAAIGELGDVASAIGGLNQSYCYPGVVNVCGRTFTSGGRYWDRSDAGDCPHDDHHAGCCHRVHGCCHHACGGSDHSCGSISIGVSET